MPMMQAAQDRREIHLPAIGDPASTGAQADGHPFMGLWYSRAQRRMGPPRL